jgi:hypothetical protein
MINTVFRTGSIESQDKRAKKAIIVPALHLAAMELPFLG